jgi:hypothetical protein
MSADIRAGNGNFWGSIMISLCVLLAITVLDGVPGALAKASESERTITFPKDQVLGALFLGHYNHNIDERGTLNRVGAAIGTVKVSVPAGYYLMFEANRRVFQNPKVLNEISPEGIDVLKIGLLSMDDSEDKLCDAALGYIGHFTGLTTLDVERSDATDKGLSVLHNLKHLRRMCCFNSQVDGSFIKELAELPEFKELDTSWCAIKPENFKYLPQLRALEFLCISRSGLEISGVRELAKCISLKSLRVGQNPLFTDECLKLLASLKRLEWLDLRETPVTMKGIRSLRGLSLKKFNPPAALNTMSDREEMKKLFPEAEIMFNSHAVPADINRTYAPLK